MKTSFFLLLFFLLSSSTNAQPAPSDTMKVIILSNRVGESIDSEEREKFSLMPAVKNFSNAVFYRTASDRIIGLISTNQPDGTTAVTVQEYPLVVLFRMAEKINNYEALIARRYIQGEEIVTMDVVGGTPLVWMPEMPRQTREPRAAAQSPMEILSTEPEGDLADEGLWKRLEFRLSAGYGFPAGGAPLRNYSEIRNYGNPSFSEITGAKDENASVSQGYRTDLRMVYHVNETIGFFVEAGMTSGETESKISTTREYDNPPGYEVTSTRKILPVASRYAAGGMQFRWMSWRLHPYGGAGVGLWFPPDMKWEVHTTGSPAMDQTIVTRFRNSVGYTGFLGISLPIASTVDLFVEGKTAFVIFYAIEEEIERYVVNGVDAISNLSTSDRIIFYEENRNYRVSPIFNPNVPRFGGPPQPKAAGAVSISVGMSVRL